MNKSIMKSGIRTIWILSLIVMTASLAGIIFAQEATETPHPPHWEYEGEAGPETWGQLADEFALCGIGEAQSPIDITGATELNLSDIEFNYGETALNIFDNGHTVQVNADAGSSITYNGITYDLIQFHFHHPSEHTFDGVAADMEIHFVHRDPNSGNLAVVGVMLTLGDATNEDYAAIFDHLPSAVGEATPTGDIINLASLLPADSLFTTYNGSLTTPPCSEIVRWLVLDTPVSLSSEQIEAFAAIHELNARPVQPLNDRDLLGDNG